MNNSLNSVCSAHGAKRNSGRRSQCKSGIAALIRLQVESTRAACAVPLPRWGRGGGGVGKLSSFRLHNASPPPPYKRGRSTLRRRRLPSPAGRVKGVSSGGGHRPHRLHVCDIGAAAPVGLGAPTVVSLSLSCCHCRMTMPPMKTTIAEIHIHVMKPMMAPERAVGLVVAAGKIRRVPGDDDDAPSQTMAANSLPGVIERHFGSSPVGRSDEAGERRLRAGADAAPADCPMVTAPSPAYPSACR